VKEQDIQREITKLLEAEGCYVVKVVSATRAGVPDILGCYEGMFFGIEVKKPNTMNTVSKLQEYNLDKIRLAGGNSMVACSTDGVIEFLRGLLV